MLSALINRNWYETVPTMQEPANIPRSNTNCKSTQFPDVSTALPDSRQIRISAMYDVKALVAIFFPAGQEPQFWEKI